MDEASGRANITDDMMIDTYRLVRDIDPYHPVYQTENLDFVWAGKTSDILGIDPYGRPDSKTVTRKTEAAIEAVGKYGKPVVAMVQAFKQGLGTTTYFPEPNEGRLSLYQCLLAGGKGLSYYGLAVGGIEKGQILSDTPLWGALVEFEQKDKVLMYDHFVFGDTPVFNRQTKYARPVWYHSFVKDGDIYMIVANNAFAENTASIPLTSYNQKVTINGYTAVVHSGADAATIRGLGNTLDVTIKPNTVVVYKITPNIAQDFSSLTKEAYEKALADGNTSGVVSNIVVSDLGNYEWAKASIMSILDDGIANMTGETTYSPAANITRGDFAMFLIRTLGIKSDSTENFLDVDANAAYAKEIAIGKAVGILTGVGDNKYNPEAAITRQDLLTICARGMEYAQRLTGWEGITGTITGFADADLVAEYAVPSVATMIREKIIQGNPDGTINPLGNTTRAEAAVIMARIGEK